MITDVEKAEIVAMYERGDRLTDIAERFGIHPRTATEIAKRMGCARRSHGGDHGGHRVGLPNRSITVYSKGRPAPSVGCLR
jgi:transposase-like protein